MKHNGKDIVIRFAAFPEIVQGTARGITTERAESYMILIDNTRCRLQQCRSLGHELAHIYSDHFQSKLPIEAIEHEANIKAWDYYRAYKSGQLAAMV